LAKKLSGVEQFSEMPFDLTVKQMVALGRTPYKHFLEAHNQKDDEIVLASIEKVGLLSQLNSSFSSLSGGEKQRVVLARAIAQEPSFMILDEPTNHLDIHYQLSLLKTIQNLNISVLAVLHDLELAARFCDYLYAFQDGTVLAQGSPKEVLTKEILFELYQVPCEIYEKPVTKHLGIEFLEE
jgi:iron complex transport system ATP-binding protein